MSGRPDPNGAVDNLQPEPTTTRVLVIGGAGVFGHHLARGLAVAGLDVVLAGRSLPRATDAVAELKTANPPACVSAISLDTATLTPQDLLQTGAAVIVDAAEPFQGADSRTARAAIAAGLHYVDLADARDFVSPFRRSTPRPAPPASSP